jgi:2-dehydropantoate 2-reductase
MRIVMMGAGGVGGYFGGKLARAGVSVTLVARGAHLEALRARGLSVRSAVEGEWQTPIAAVGDLRGLPAADFVIVAVKSFDTESALEAVRPAVGPGTAVLTLQNGVDNVEKIERILGPGHALGGVAYVFAGIEAPGVITHRAAGRVALGEMDGTVSARGERLHAAFVEAGVPVELSTRIEAVLWEKYLFIAAQAGMTALTRCPIGVIRGIPETWRRYRAILDELAALAAAAKIPLAPGIVDTLVKAAEALGPETVSSLYGDLVQGKRLELEGLHGHAVRLGERYGVPTPATAAVYAALLPHGAGRRG